MLAPRQDRPRAMTSTWRYCGQDFSEEEIEVIRQLCATLERRAHIAAACCEVLSWRYLDGRPKDMSCRVALIRMEADGLISLPPARNGNGNAKMPRHGPAQAQLPLVSSATSLQECQPVSLQVVKTKADSVAWRKLIATHHYLGYVPFAGAQLRYLVHGASGLLGALGFAASAWKCKPRDDHIGWDAATRHDRLHLVVGNARFLLLPEPKVQSLASHVLGAATRRIASDWQKAYGYAPALLETFVESGRFAGTSYKAANWVYVGQTKGRGKLDRYNQAKLPVKDIYLYPPASRLSAGAQLSRPAGLSAGTVPLRLPLGNGLAERVLQEVSRLTLIWH